jgi:hypothetical protein
VPKTPRKTSSERKKKYLKILLGGAGVDGAGAGGVRVVALTIGGTGGKAVGVGVIGSAVIGEVVTASGDSVGSGDAPEST